MTNNEVWGKERQTSVIANTLSVPIILSTVGVSLSPRAHTHTKLLSLREKTKAELGEPVCLHQRTVHFFDVPQQVNSKTTALPLQVWEITKYTQANRLDCGSYKDKKAFFNKL